MNPVDADGSTLVLASTSRYRAELLRRLRVAFAQCAPDVDESRRPGESPQALALRLAEHKARAVASAFPQAWVIGSDQVCALGDESLGKPGTVEAAQTQLQRLSGRAAVFHTAVCVVAPGGRHLLRNVPTEVEFRQLSAAEIATYVDLDNPLDCAGSAKSESLGPVLLRHMRSDDPTALVGLPLIAVCDMLRETGFDPLEQAQRQARPAY